MKSAGKARNNGLYRHIRTSKEIIRNLLNDYLKHLKIYTSSTCHLVGIIFSSNVYFGTTLCRFLSLLDIRLLVSISHRTASNSSRQSVRLSTSIRNFSKGSSDAWGDSFCRQGQLFTCILAYTPIQASLFRPALRCLSNSSLTYCLYSFASQFAKPPCAEPKIRRSIHSTNAYIIYYTIITLKHVLKHIKH